METDTGTKRFPKRPGRLGITLVETLVAVAVIGVLAGLLWPALAISRERALSSKCVSNLRQVGVALFAYSGDHQSKIPPRYIDLDYPDKSIAGNYWHQTLRNGGYFGPPQDESTKAKKTAVQKTGVHFCPKNPSKGGSEESYGMRRWRTPGQVWDTTQNLLAIKDRADFFLMTDSYKPETGTQGYFVGPGSTAYRIHFTHNGFANTLFADGRVAAMKREYFEALPSRQKEYQDASVYSYWPEPNP